MAIRKLSNKPYSNIADWLWERNKKFTPNPLKPHKKKTRKEQKLNATNLQYLLKRTHAPDGLINEIIDEVNTLIQKVASLENQKSMIGHAHGVTVAGPSGPMTGGTDPSTNRKGGKLQTGGRTVPVTTSREDYKKKLISQITRLQNNDQ